MTDASGATPISHLTGGIWEALVTTAGGLGVAIPAFVAYNYLSGRVSSLMSDMERAGIEVLQMLKDPIDDSSPLDGASSIPAAGIDGKKDSEDTPKMKSSGDKGDAKKD